MYNTYLKYPNGVIGPVIPARIRESSLPVLESDIMEKLFDPMNPKYESVTTSIVKYFPNIVPPSEQSDVFIILEKPECKTCEKKECAECIDPADIVKIEQCFQKRHMER
ncbi:MAG: hypothetical protein FWG18_02455 [Alphaproteobacteria bacterium]|nr:hypothetical protein [Alphaproteobacteria bacterium]